MSVAASSLSFIDGSILSVALPAIRAGTGANAAEVQWVVNIYTLPLAALILLGGSLGDHQGRRRWLVIGTTLFGVGSLISALSGSIEPLLVGRTVQGIGAGLLLPNSLALLNGAFKGEARGRAIGIWAAAGGIAAAIAPLLGGWLVAHVGWESIFYINLPFVAAAILIALTRVAEAREPEKAHLDAGGATLATVGLAAATYGLTLWSQKFVMTPVAGGAMVVGAVLLAGFLFLERWLGTKAMMPLTLFSENCCFAALNLMTFLLYGAFGGAMLLIPYVLIEAGGYSPVEAGLSLLPLSILLGIGSPLMGKLAVRIGPRLPVTIGPVIVGAGLALATRVAAGQDYWTHVFPAILVMSIGMTLAVAPLTSTILAAVEKRQTGMASGLNSAVARLGGLIAIALLGAVFAQHGKTMLAPFAVALVIMGIVAALGGVAAWFGLGGRWRRNNA
jgi:EmrB/QacA subfamily drug resistance transporter